MFKVMSVLGRLKSLPPEVKRWLIDETLAFAEQRLAEERAMGAANVVRVRAIEAAIELLRAIEV